MKLGRKRFKKAVDIHDDADRLIRVMDQYLEAHEILYRKHHHQGFFRYLVEPCNLCCAQAVLPALQDIAEHRA